MCGATVLQDEGGKSYTFICGGCAISSHDPQSGIYCYCIDTKKWCRVECDDPHNESTAALPCPLFGHRCVSHGSYIWVVGGSSSGGQLLRSAIQMRVEFKTDSKEETRLIIHTVKVYPFDFSTLFGASVKLVSLRKYSPFFVVLFGITSSLTQFSRPCLTNRTYAINLDDPAVHRVAQRGDVPTPRACAAACVHNGNIILFGGRDEEKALNDLYVGQVSIDDYRNSITIDWKQYHPRSKAEVSPGPRIAHELSACGDLIALTGGQPSQTPPKSYLLHVAENGICSWSELSHVIRRAFHAAFPTANGILLVGGSSGTQSVREMPIDLTVKPLAPAPEDPNDTVTFSLRCEGSTTPLAVTFTNKKELTLTELKMRLAAEGKITDVENLVIDYVVADNTVCPLHMPHVLRELLAHPSEHPIELRVRVDPPPLHYTIAKRLGRGSYGEVFMAINQTTGSFFALKVVDVSCSERSNLESLRNEIQMMRQLRHDNLVHYLGSRLVQEDNTTKMLIFMDYIAGGDTLEHLSRETKLSIRLVQVYVRQLLHALAFLHEHQIAHRDVKGANVLLDVEGVVKLSDFGTAKRISTTSGSRAGIAGTVLFMAPEVICGDTYGTAADIWSLGCLVVELVTQNPPFSEKKFTEPLQVVHHVGVQKNCPAIPDCFGPTSSGRSFLEKCFIREQEKRPTAKELLQHPFITTLEAEETAAPPPESGSATTVEKSATSIASDLPVNRTSRPRKMIRKLPPTPKK